MWSNLRFSRVNGHEIADGDKEFTVTCDCGSEPVSKTFKASTPKGRQRSMEMAVKWVYDVHGAIVLERQGYKCGNCGDRRVTDRHHIIHRSKGRSDVVENLIYLCQSCHRQEHGG